MIEVAEASMLPAIGEMVRACIAHLRAAGIEQWDEVYPTGEYFERDCAAGNLYVLRDAGSALLGCAGLDERQSPEYAGVPWRHEAERIGVIHRVIISPRQQGKGHAKVLMRALEEEARRRGYRAIRLDAYLLNPASLRLYDGLGYERCGAVRFRKGEFACFEKRLDGK